MIHFPEPWLACHVTRWHSGPSAPWLAHTQDRLHGHGGRMAVLALHVWGDDASRQLLAACILHDLGEYHVADVPAPAKADRTLRAALDRLEDMALYRMGLSYGLSADDDLRLKFLDRWDAYLWAQLHAPQILQRADWLAGLARLKRLALDAGHDLNHPARPVAAIMEDSR